MHADTCQNIRCNVLHPRRKSGRGRGKRGKEGREREQEMRAREGGGEGVGGDVGKEGMMIRGSSEGGEGERD